VEASFQAVLPGKPTQMSPNRAVDPGRKWGESLYHAIQTAFVRRFHSSMVRLQFALLADAVPSAVKRFRHRQN
jgi:hypothetical protein